jgi:hypothetical protein
MDRASFSDLFKLVCSHSSNILSGLSLTMELAYDVQTVKIVWSNYKVSIDWCPCNAAIAVMSRLCEIGQVSMRLSQASFYEQLQVSVDSSPFAVPPFFAPLRYPALNMLACEVPEQGCGFEISFHPDSLQAVAAALLRGVEESDVFPNTCGIGSTGDGLASSSLIKLSLESLQQFGYSPHTLRSKAYAFNWSSATLRCSSAVYALRALEIWETARKGAWIYVRNKSVIEVVEQHASSYLLEWSGIQARALELVASSRAAALKDSKDQTLLPLLRALSIRNFAESQLPDVEEARKLRHSAQVALCQNDACMPVAHVLELGPCTSFHDLVAATDDRPVYIRFNNCMTVEDCRKPLMKIFADQMASVSWHLWHEAGVSKSFAMHDQFSLSWDSVSPFLRGIKSAATSPPSDRDDELARLMLDKRLLRTKGMLVSSFMAGAIVRFLPTAGNE